jgi:hypothetical protein
MALMDNAASLAPRAHGRRDELTGATYRASSRKKEKPAGDCRRVSVPSQSRALFVMHDQIVGRVGVIAIEPQVEEGRGRIIGHLLDAVEQHLLNAGLDRVVLSG